MNFRKLMNTPIIDLFRKPKPASFFDAKHRGIYHTMQFNGTRILLKRGETERGWNVLGIHVATKIGDNFSGHATEQDVFMPNILKDTSKNVYGETLTYYYKQVSGVVKVDIHQASEFQKAALL